MPDFLDLTNKRFSRLLVLKWDSSKERTSWICKCDCGKIKSIRSNHLVDGKTHSCGCLHKERSSARSSCLHLANTKTGLSRSKTYSAWAGMKQRCTNPRSKFFAYYGGRGITICADWIDSFENFLKDMGEKPEDMSLDRINNNGSYEPGNCRWATKKEQQNNLRSNRIYNLYGKDFTISQLSEKFGIHRNTLDRRLKLGIPVIQAVIPPKKY